MKLRVLLAVLLLLSTSLMVLDAASSQAAAASPTAYVSVTLTNSQTTATVKNMSQLIKVDWSTYATDLNANVSNVRFYNSTTFSSSSELSGWIEDNNTTTATSSNVWVNLSGTIVPASGSVIIYMAFLAKTASWSSHWGLAPQLSTTYGQFDNGANVFEFYDNFKGTTLNAVWTEITNDGGTIAVNNGLTLTPAGTEYTGGIYESKKSFTEPSIIESLSEFATTSATAWAKHGIGIVSTSEVSTIISSYHGDVNSYYSSATQYVETGTANDFSSTASNSFSQPSKDTIANENPGTYQIWGVEINPTQTQSYRNYTEFGSEASTYYFTSGVTGYPFMTTDANGGVAHATWYRVRSAPPAGIMPSTSFGSVTTVSSALKYQISFSQTTLPSGTKWGIRLNNTTTTIWQNSTSEYDNLTSLASGSYTFHVINATGYASNPYTGLLTIVSTNLTQSVTFTGYALTVAETGLPSGDTWFLNLSNQPGLSESGTGQKLSGTAASLSTYLPNDTYTYTYETSDKRYSGGSGSFTVNGAAYSLPVTFSAVLYYVNFTQLHKPAAVQWGVNVSGTIKTGTGNLSFQFTNGTYYYNASAINQTFSHPLGWWRLTNGTTVLLHNESTFLGMKVIVNGKNLENNITFQRAYNFTFEEMGIGTGATWTISSFSNGLGSTLTKSLAISSKTEIYFNSTEGNYTNGSYSGSIESTISGATGIRYINFTLPSTSTYTVAGADIVNVTNYITQYYLTTRSLPTAGGYHSPYSGWVNASSKVQLSAQANSSYDFTGFIGSNVSSFTGYGTYSNGQFLATITMTNPITENVTFGQYTVLTFYMQNLTSGTEWGVKLATSSGALVQWDNGSGNYIIFEVSPGTYTYLVTGVTSTPQTNTIAVSGSEDVVLQYNLATYKIAFHEQGLQSGQPWSVTTGNSQYTYTMSSATQYIYVNLPNGTFSYSVAEEYGYIASNGSGSLTIAGTSLTIRVNWTEGNPFILEGIQYFIPIFLNTTDFTIPSGTQVPVNVNWSAYSHYENSNLSNVMMLNASFYPLYSWIQDNASSSAKSSTVWVKLQQAISTYSSQLLYLCFFKSDINNLNPVGYWGEAPQLSPLYGQYNNIRMVMNPGLLLQFYVNSTAAYLVNGPPFSLTAAAGLLKGDYITASGNRYYATGSYLTTPGSTGVSEIYQDIANANYVPYAQESNVVISYQTEQGKYPGTWPSPPIISTENAQTWLAKAVGFVQQDQLQTEWYSFCDDNGYLNISNSTSYLGPQWAAGINVVSTGTSAQATTLLSGSSYIQGTSELSFIYAELNGAQAMWQFWSSARVALYHPNPVNVLPSISFGTVGTSYSSFTSYGLAPGTTWAIAIDGRILQSNTNVIYDYLPTGSYFFSIGSVVNDTFLAGIDGAFFPTPGQGFIVIDTFFTSQVILWQHANIKAYDLIPGQSAAVLSGSDLNITMPVFVTDINGLPANATTIATIWAHLQLRYVSKLQSQNFNVTWSFSNSGLGMFAVFFTLTKAQVAAVKNGTAVISMVSEFRFGTFNSLATGIAGTSSFNGINTSTPTKPPPNIIGLGPPPPGANLNSIGGILAYLGYLGQSSVGRSIYFILLLIAVAYYVLRINNENLKKAKKRKLA